MFYRDDTHSYKQYRVLVVAMTKKAAAEQLKLKVVDFNHSFSKTGNALELQITAGHPTGVWVTQLNWWNCKPEDYVKVA